MSEPRPDTHHKALQINLDACRYGTFAEIGAGQEVARWFFHVGRRLGHRRQDDLGLRHDGQRRRLRADRAATSAASASSRCSTTSTTCCWSACDAQRGEDTAFFVFADTVATRSYSHPEDGRGWLGIRFQTAPRSAPSQIIIHARMWDRDNAHQQEALGILGVNLIYGAFYLHADREELIGALMDDLTRDRMEVDMIRVLRAGLRRGGQPADEPAARAAAPDQRGRVHRRGRGRGTGGAAPPASRC